MIRRLAIAALITAALGLSACASAPDATGDEPRGGTIALLLPDTDTARYESTDRPMFERVAAQRCPECRLLYANAGSDAARQQEQAETMLARGAKVLVLDAVDTVAAASIVAAATRNDALVIAYDRFIDAPGVTAYVSFDSTLIGRQQATAVREAIEGTGTANPGVLLLNGSATDPNAAALRTGALQALKGSGIEVLAELDTPGWSSARAQEWTTAQIARFPGRIDGVIAANDALAGGAIAALNAAGIHPLPPVSGQDAELSAVQRIVAGEQLMTVAKAADDQARTAAEVAVRLVRGEHPLAPTRIRGVASFVLAPTVAFRDDLARVVVQGRMHDVHDICTASYAAACIDLGLIEEDSE